MPRSTTMRSGFCRRTNCFVTKRNKSTITVILIWNVFRMQVGRLHHFELHIVIGWKWPINSTATKKLAEKISVCNMNKNSVEIYQNYANIFCNSFGEKEGSISLNHINFRSIIKSKILINAKVNVGIDALPFGQNNLSKLLAFR